MLHAANHFAADFLLRDEPHIDQPAQMKGKGRGWNMDARLDIADVQAGGPSANQ
jgi:hypothetical protein